MGPPSLVRWGRGLGPRTRKVETGLPTYQRTKMPLCLEGKKVEGGPKGNGEFPDKGQPRNFSKNRKRADEVFVLHKRRRGKHQLGWGMI